MFFIALRFRCLFLSMNNVLQYRFRMHSFHRPYKIIALDEKMLFKPFIESVGSKRFKSSGFTQIVLVGYLH